MIKHDMNAHGKRFFVSCITFLFLTATPLCIFAQQPTPTPPQQEGTGNYVAQRNYAFRFYDENNFTAALPLFEKLVIANPLDREVNARLGFILIGSATSYKDPEQRKKVRARGRGFLVRAQQLGADDALTKEMLERTPLDGSDVGDASFSNKQEIDEAMREGEAAFSRGDFNKALAAYGRALKADPKLYEAALFTGDVYYKSEQPDKAGAAFAQAIAIDPDRETAYRYWGDVLMKQGKTTEARDKFIEAYIAAPYNRLAQAGFVQWANQNGVKLAHPNIVVPTNVSSPEKGKINITLDPSMLGKSDTGTAAWMMYGLTRSLWISEKFAKAYPNEKAYRHSLAEEADALRMVIESVKTQKKDKRAKTLDPSLAALSKLNDDGLLEAYILIARPDAGIAQDYAAYRRANRDKLRRYVTEYVLHNGGSDSGGK